MSPAAALRVVALVFWLACVAYVAVPSASPGASPGAGKPFHQPAEPVLRILRHEL